MKQALSLLPYSSITFNNTKEIIRILKLFKNLIFFAIQAIDHFIYGNYQFFDALIGDNLCQVRAYKTYLLSFGYYSNFNKNILLTKKDKFSLLQEQISIKINDIEKMGKKSPQDIILFLKNNKKMDSIFNDNVAKIFLSSEEIYIIMLYLLSRYTIVNEAGVHMGINYEQMCSEINCSKTFARKLVHYYQIELSLNSCEFIIQLAREISEVNFDETLLKFFIFKDDDCRSILPCFLVTEVLLSHMKKTKCPILIESYIYFKDMIINRVLILYTYDIMDKAYKIVNPNEWLIQNNNRCIIFRGIAICKDQNRDFCKYMVEKIKEIGVENVIMLNMATHPQYPGKLLRIYSDNPYVLPGLETLHKKEKKFFTDFVEKFQKMKYLTYIHGCCQENPSLFFSTHIYLGNVNQYYSELKEIFSYEMA